MDDTKSKVTAISFERDEPFPQERKGELFGIVNEVMNFAIQNHEVFIIQQFEAVFQALRITNPQREFELKHHAFWWIVFCQRLENEKITIFHEFIHQKWTRWRFDHTILQVLFSWAFIHPSFYTVIDSRHDRQLTLIDLTNGELKNVTVYNEAFSLPEPGDLLSGLLLSYCDGTFSPIFDFLQIKKTSANSLLQKLFTTYHYSKSDSISNYIQQQYDDLLSLMYPYLNQ